MNLSDEIFVTFLNGGIYEIFTIMAMYFIFQITLHIEKRRKLFFVLFFMSMFLANMTIIYVQFSELNIQHSSIITKILMISNTLFYIIVLKILTRLDYLHIFLVDMFAQILVGVTVFAPYTLVAKLIGENTHSLMNFEPQLKNIIGLIAVILIMSTLIVLTRFLLKKYLSNFYQKKLKWKWLLWGVIAIFSISGLMTTSGGTYQKDEIVVITSIVMIILSIIILYEVSWWVRHLKEKEIKEENRILSIENAVMKEYYDTLEYQLEQTRKFRHDIEKHMNVIKEMVSNNSLYERGIGNNELTNFTGRIEEQYSLLEEEHFCDNPVVNAILVNKKNQCKEKGIEIHVMADPFTASGIKEMDLIAIISNLMDNAIEACVNSKRRNGLKKIWFESKSNESMLLLKVNNTIENSQMDIGENTTWKKDTYAHGVGLSIVHEIVDKYDGIFQMKIEHGVCKVTIKLKNSHN